MRKITEYEILFKGLERRRVCVVSGLEEYFEKKCKETNTSIIKKRTLQ